MTNAPSLPPECRPPLVALYLHGGALVIAGMTGRRYTRWHDDGSHGVFDAEAVANLRARGLVTETGRISARGKIVAAYWAGEVPK